MEGERSLFDLSGKRAIVLGGAGLIGAAAAAALLDAGAHVVVADRARSSLPGALGKEVDLVEVDATDLDRLPEMVAKLEDHILGADIWVSAHYPRTTDWGVPDEEVSTQSWHQNVSMQLTGSCIVASEICRSMAKRNGGCVVNLASMYGIVGPDFSLYDGLDITTPAPYPAIKGGIIAHTRYLATLWGQHGVRVNAVAAGGVARDQPDEFVQAYAQRTPLGRLAKAKEIGGPIAFLASPAAAYITGTTLVVDGGWTAK
ncbi:MAG: SDR family oxidoreductase [Alphaproteobacteria bacterium]|nr:SDR family oxidoreductase [Alphaproteobacteria bacterium]